jgi:hypothetical protein
LKYILPTWLDEGLAEFYAYTRFEGDHIDIGAPSVRLNHLKSESLIPIPQMMTANARTFFNDKRQDDLFYGEAWPWSTTSPTGNTWVTALS